MQGPTARRTLLPIILVAGVIQLTAGAALAQEAVSPSITPSRLTVDSPVPSGARTSLPSLAVRNTGSASLEYRMAPMPPDASSGSAAPGWVRLEPSEFSLAPGEAREVRVVLDVPAGEPVGAHSLLLQASVVPAAGASGIRVAVTAAVAARLEFSVGPPAPDDGGASMAVMFGGLTLVALIVGSATYWVSANSKTLRDRLEFRSPVTLRPPKQPPPPEERSGPEEHE